ncbi:dynamin family protein [uncultured Helicobacter sp.]|uniref:dynamin family protein n=1 Tax=uncultured Helicobacter sp. TaxID=175537 RepID=UPI00374F01A3
MTQEQLQKLDTYLLENDEMLALVYACDEALLPKFSQTQVMQDFFTQFFDKTPTIDDLNAIKHLITPKLTQPLYAALMKHFLTLCEAQVISKAYFHHLLLSIQSHKQDSQTPTHTHSTQKDLCHTHARIEEFYQALQSLCTQDSQTQALHKIWHNTKEQKFSIGVTGVLSAGKSTFLNALLGEEILGSSTIPETANLTVLQYDTTQYAKVHFWNQKEWEEILLDSATDEGLRRFVQQTQEAFADTLQEYITPQGLQKHIELHELNAYTSANHTSKMCNLIKKVELFTPLKFLQGGVHIVDTPGLDDPITKREEITKDYIKDCDLLIHLMNASCAATQVDVDFILETLIERNISRLLVVLTRSDLITPEELHQSLEYTKQSLQNAIVKISQSLDSHAILSRITFLPISSYNALMARTQDVAPMPIEQTGILAIEEYLDTMLLGENSLKARDIAYLCLKSFANIAQDITQDLSLESKILHASKEELQDFIAQQQAQNALLEKKSAHIAQTITTQKQELQSTLKILNDFITMSLQTSQDRLKERVTQNLTYATKQNRSITKDDLNELFSIALKDIFTDITREYKYKLNTKITHLIQEVDTKLQEFCINLNLSHTPPSFSFYAKDEQIAHFVHTLSQEVFTLKSSSALANKLDSLFSDTFKQFSELIFTKSTHTKQALLEFFDSISMAIAQDFQRQIAHKNEALQKALEQFEKSNNQETKDALASKLDSIIQLKERITQAYKELE